MQNHIHVIEFFCFSVILICTNEKSDPLLHNWIRIEPTGFPVTISLIQVLLSEQLTLIQHY